MEDCRPCRGRVVDSGQQLRPFVDRPSQDGIHQPRSGIGAPPPLGALSRDARLRQLDGLVDRGVVGRGAGLEQLEQAESQGGQHRPVQLVGRAGGEQLDQMVGRAASLDRAVREPLRLGSLTSVQTVARGGGRECAIGPRVVLEDPAENLIGGAAPGRHVDGSRRARDHFPRSSPALSRGSGWPRR